MSQLINVADDVYANLTRIKKKRNASYSEVIREFLPKEEEGKTITHKEMIEWVKSRERKNVKTRVIDHDLILYGVSRENSR